jgi:hypothetical protein
MRLMNGGKQVMPFGKIHAYDADAALTVCGRIAVDTLQPCGPFTSRGFGRRCDECRDIVDATATTAQ